MLMDFENAIGFNMGVDEDEDSEDDEDFVMVTPDVMRVGGGRSCSLCHSPNVNMPTCPLNPYRTR
jgi:hypothetical protein